MKEPLTDRQQEILDFIKKYIKENGFPPSVKDIQDHFGFKSKNAVTDFLKVLVKKGYIFRAFNVSRGIKVL